MNRIETAIEKMKISIENKLANNVITQAKVDESRKNLDMSFDEHFRFQNLKSEAFVMETLNLDEAQSLYALLGNTVETFNRQPIHVKAVLTQAFSELLGAKIKAKQKLST